MMGEGCIEGYIFGSVSRMEATSSSDVDLILVLKKPTDEERFDWNTSEELEKRNYSYNFARNSHQIFNIREKLENLYGFSISVYTHYMEDGPEEVVPLHDKAYVPFKDLICDSIPL
tara:strand:- start:615 stop:962 length:348 start_codon:yes stop_codon:yes gene_type:complete